MWSVCAARRLGLHDAASGDRPRAEVLTVGALHVHPELRGDDELVTLAVQRLAEHLLALPGVAAVDVGGVEQGHARLARGTQQVVEPAGRRAGRGVAAEADRADHEAAAADGPVPVAHGPP